MPYDDPDHTDPMELVAHGVPAPEGTDDLMAMAIVDEFVRMGMERDEILELFRNPFFAMTHRIWRRYGDAYCVSLLDRATAKIRPARGDGGARCRR